jgi:[ribosomal protein S18]-alanine N-acetyltransferase
MVVIRKAAASEAADLVGIGVRAWTGHVFAFEPETAGMRARARRAFEDLCAHHLDTITVAEVEGTLRGWGARETRSDVITDLWVDPEWQGRGVGSALIVSLVGQVRRAGFGSARLETHARNVDAIRLYEHLGFRIVERKLELSTSLDRPIEKVLLERAV